MSAKIKNCEICRIALPLKSKGKICQNEKCQRERRRRHLKNFHTKNPERRGDYARKRKYGITKEQYIELIKSTGEKCQICGEQPKNKKDLVIDHDHNTGKIRGILCRICNAILGKFEPNIRKFLEYLNYSIKIV